MTNITGYFINQTQHCVEEGFQIHFQKEWKVYVFKQNKYFDTKNALVLTA